jgi:2'-5' RNA ligase
MKNYIIVALPDKETNDHIEELRKGIIGQGLVDSLPPHVTFKRRFVLNNGFSEDDLVGYFKGLRFKRFKVDFIGVKTMNDVIALAGESSEMKDAHISVVSDLEGKITTQNPEWEKDDYKIHMTLWRELTKDVVSPGIKTAVFDRLVLYEIDPSPERLFADEIARTELS